MTEIVVYYYMNKSKTKRVDANFFNSELRQSVSLTKEITLKRTC